MNYKRFTLFILVGAMVIGGTNIALARVYNKERVTKKEVAKWYGNNWAQGDFRGGVLFEKIATDSYIEHDIIRNERVKELHQKAIDSQKESTTASGN